MAANEVAARRLNRTLNELIGQNVYDLLPPEVAQSEEPRERKIKTGKVVRFDDGRDGTYFYSTVYPIFDPAGRVSQIGVYAIDVTKEKQTQAELEKIKARLECLLNHSPSAV